MTTRDLQTVGSAEFLLAYADAVKAGYGLRDKTKGYPQIEGMLKTATLHEGVETPVASDTDDVVHVFENSTHAFLQRVEALVQAGYEVDLKGHVAMGAFLKQARFVKPGVDAGEATGPAPVEAEDQGEVNIDRTYTQEQLEDFTMTDLRKIGEKYEVKDTKKADLIEKILKAQNGGVEVAEEVEEAPAEEEKDSDDE